MTDTVSLTRNAGSRLDSRVTRGIALAEERFDEIVRIKPWTWIVPSAEAPSIEDGAYIVNLKHGICSCPDYRERIARGYVAPDVTDCKHIVAATYVQARTAQCAGCRGRFRARDLYEVGDDHLTFFEGDELCESCAMNHGVL